MVGWVGGRVGSIKIKDHLSPVEIEIGAELGNMKMNVLMTTICMMDKLMMIGVMDNWMMVAVMINSLTSTGKETRRKEREKMEIGSVMVVLCRLGTTPVRHTLKQILCSKSLLYE